MALFELKQDYGNETEGLPPPPTFKDCAAADIDTLTQKLREYSAADESEKPGILEDLNEITAAMDEGAVTEYIALLMQVQSLLDSGMTQAEVQSLFPELDFSGAMDQIAAIQSFLSDRKNLRMR